MRVTIAAEIFPPSIGGPASYAAALERALQDLQTPVRLVCYKTGTTSHEVSREWISLEMTKTQRVIAYARALMSAPSPSVIYAQGLIPSGLPALIASRRLKVPLVVRCPGDYAWEVMRRSVRKGDIGTYALTSDLPKRIQRIRDLQKTVLAGAMRVIVPCRFLEEIIYGWGIEPQKIHVIPNVPFFPDAVKAENVRNRTFLFVGRFVNWKGIEGVITAFGQVSKVFEDARLALIGDGPERQRLVELIKSLGLTSRISVLGQQPRPLVIQRIRDSFALLLNSSYECCSNVALEALALGTPVIASDIPGNLDILAHHSTALIFEQGNVEQLSIRMLELLQNVSLYSILSENGLKQSLNYTFAQMISATLDVLREATMNQIGNTKA